MGFGPLASAAKQKRIPCGAVSGYGESSEGLVVIWYSSSTIGYHRCHSLFHATAKTPDVKFDSGDAIALLLVLRLARVVRCAHIIYMRACVYACECVGVWVCVRECACMCVHVCACLLWSGCVCAPRACVCPRLSSMVESLSPCQCCVLACVRAWVCVHACMHACMHTCVSRAVCLRHFRRPISGP